MKTMKKLTSTVIYLIVIFFVFVSSGCGGGNYGGSSGPPPPPQKIISTIAGNGTSGYAGDGGIATSAEINSPYGVAVDGSRNIYIADTGNDVIRKVDSTGKITTIAGTGVQGYNGDGGQATSATLYSPTRAVADQAGNIYIADFYNNRIRKVDTSGIITTVAGIGTAGYSGDGGPATAAELYWPYAVAVDNLSNIYIADSVNNRIRKVDASGTINTIAGTGFPGVLGDGGPATAAQVNEPEDVAVDNTGNVYIADYGNSKIRKINTSGVISTIAGTGSPGYGGDNGPAISAILNLPTGVAADNAGNVYIADYQNNRIRKVDTSGTIATIAGTGTAGYSGDGGPPTSAAINWPEEVAIDTTGNVYIADYNNMRIREIH